MANQEIKSKEKPVILLNKISDKSREFVRLISSSAMEEIHYSPKDIKSLVEKNKELKKEIDDILTILTDLEVIHKEKDERK